MDLILIAVISLGAIGLVSAVILYVASKKFAVYEDPRIAKVAEVLPQANCGGCGYPGCSGFAAACVKAGSLEGKLCPVGGQPTMEKVAAILGLEAAASEPKVAVVRCNGTCEHRPRLTKYDGVRSCVIANTTFGGETGCSFGCLGCGDCEDACNFDAIHINPETGIPEVDESKCTACGACSKACPRNIIEIRPKGRNNRRVYVSCVNKDKGAVARKACTSACIGCGKCVKVCPFEAITLENNLAYIDPTKCKSCRKCEMECPQGAIIAMNFPPRKPKPATDAAAKPAPRPRPAAATAAPAASAEKTAAPAKPVETPAAAPQAKPVEAKPVEVKADAPVKEAPAAPAKPVEKPAAKETPAEKPAEAPAKVEVKAEPVAEPAKVPAEKETPKADAPKAEVKDASKAEEVKPSAEKETEAPKTQE